MIQVDDSWHKHNRNAGMGWVWENHHRTNGMVMGGASSGTRKSSLQAEVMPCLYGTK